MKTIQIFYNDENESFKTFHYVEEVRLDRNVRALVIKVSEGKTIYFNIDYLIGWDETN